jgi:hypothetical protein
MSDDIPPLGERRYEPRLTTEAGLEFIMERIAALPTQRELVRCSGAFAARGPRLDMLT